MVPQSQKDKNGWTIFFPLLNFAMVLLMTDLHIGKESRIPTVGTAELQSIAWETWQAGLNDSRGVTGSFVPTLLYMSLVTAQILPLFSDFGNIRHHETSRFHKPQWLTPVLYMAPKDKNELPYDKNSTITSASFLFFQYLSIKVFGIWRVSELSTSRPKSLFFDRDRKGSKKNSSPSRDLTSSLSQAIVNNNERHIFDE